MRSKMTYYFFSQNLVQIYTRNYICTSLYQIYTHISASLLLNTDQFGGPWIPAFQFIIRTDLTVQGSMHSYFNTDQSGGPRILAAKDLASNNFSIGTELLQTPSLYQNQICRESVPNSGIENLPGKDLDKSVTRDLICPVLLSIEIP